MQTTLFTQRLAPLIEDLSQTLSEIASILRDAETAASAAETAPTPNQKSPQTISPKAKASEKESQDSSAKVTVEDVRAVLAEKSQDGLTAKVRELLQSFDAAKLSAVDPSRLPELLEAAKALK